MALSGCDIPWQCMGDCPTLEAASPDGVTVVYGPGFRIGGGALDPPLMAYRHCRKYGKEAEFIERIGPPCPRGSIVCPRRLNYRCVDLRPGDAALLRQGPRGDGTRITGLQGPISRSRLP